MARLFGDHAIDQAGSCFRDAQTAVFAAEAVAAERVRLGDDPPDFELICAGRLVACEAVEVQAPGRRRGRELRAERASPPEERRVARRLGEDAWLPAATVLTTLRSTVDAKAAHVPPYAPDTVLVVYLNVGFVEDPLVLAAGIKAAVSAGTTVFSEVWVLRTSGEIHRVPGEGCL